MDQIPGSDVTGNFAGLDPVPTHNAILRQLMTALFAWIDSGGAHIIADSAVTQDRPSRAVITSFGEVQTSDVRAVEEGAIKILRLSDGIVAGVAGNVAPALALLSRVREQVGVRGDYFLPFVLDEVFAGPGSADFSLLFLHHNAVLGTDHITGYLANRGIGRYDAIARNAILFAGSLTEAYRDWSVRCLTAIRELPYDSETRHALSCAWLQALGASETLLEQGVGGAFFGATVLRGEIRWSDDILYLIGDPRVFDAERHPPAAPSEVRAVPGIPDGVSLNHVSLPEGELDMVRCAVRDAHGFVTSSVLPSPKVFVPLLGPSGDWRSAFDKVPNLYRFVEATRYVVLLNRIRRRLIFIDRGRVRDTCPVLGIVNTPSRVALVPHPDLIKVWNSEVPRGQYEIYIVSDVDAPVTQNKQLLIPMQ